MIIATPRVELPKFHECEINSVDVVIIATRPRQLTAQIHSELALTRLANRGVVLRRAVVPIVIVTVARLVIEGLRGFEWASERASGQRGQKRGDDLEL
jgi:hypothetical protein